MTIERTILSADNVRNFELCLHTYLQVNGLGGYNLVSSCINHFNTMVVSRDPQGYTVLMYDENFVNNVSIAADQFVKVNGISNIQAISDLLNAINAKHTPAQVCDDVILNASTSENMLSDVD